MSLALGIDTGGTYTDGIILKLESNQVITKAKALTTPEDLTKGIHNCLRNLNLKSYRAIKMVSLSTTLATNATVEGRGSAAGLILIGHEPAGKLPVEHLAVIKGGHDIKGKPVTPLDLEEARLAIESFRGKVGTMAISGYLSIRNPEHEIKVKELVQEMLAVPVVCAHQLTTSLGFHERTVTAALNAKLIPIITGLIESVKKVLKTYGVSAPLMIVKGDGSLMSEDLTREKPIETILSGPAASLIGASSLTQETGALVLDMGGTTTDIAILQEGVPRVNPEGAVVGGWLTRVQAAEINTFGLGGDSYIQITPEREIEIGPQRVWPLAVVAHDHSYLVQELEAQLASQGELLFHQAADCFLLLPGVVPDDLTETEKRTLRLLQTGPHSLYFLAHELDKDPYLINLDRLVRLGLLARASVTPTDIVHALGTFTGWNQEAAILGTKILALRMGLDWKTFLVRAMDSIINRLCLTILQSVINFEGKQFQLGRGIEAQYFIEKILKTGKTESLELSARLQYPIIGIGAPVRAYLPGVAEKLNTRLLIPDHAEVANAIGAATGKVMEKIRMLIKPGSEGGFILHSPWERKTFMYLEDAKKYALEEAKRQASLAAERAGAVDYQLAFSCEDITSGIKSTWQDEIYVETRIEVTGVGRPKWESNHQNSTKFFIT